MSKQEKGGMRSAFHYIVEFAVILLGITVSVTIEKNNAHQYKESVKNQSLSRILTNIQTDSLDFEFNIAVHAPASASCAWITEQRSTFAEQHPDSIGKHCSMCLMAQTVFVDNQEEYRTLQNSGLMELIENDTLARALQSKYVQHEFLRKIESVIAEMAKSQEEFYFQNMTSTDSMEPFMGFVKLRTWNGTAPDNAFFERCSDIGFWHRSYADRMDRRMGYDTRLTQWIRDEIGNIE